jgi:hypothetical protein
MTSAAYLASVVAAVAAAPALPSIRELLPSVPATNSMREILSGRLATNSIREILARGSFPVIAVVQTEKKPRVAEPASVSAAVEPSERPRCKRTASFVQPKSKRVPSQE